MPIVKHNPGRDFNLYGSEPISPPEPTIGETFGAAWQMENDVANVVDMLTKPRFKPQEGFSVGPKLREYDEKNKTNYFLDHGDAFMGVRSEEEMLHTIGRVNDQVKQKDILARSGVLGFVASVGSGLVSPTSLIPFIAEGKGAVAVLRGAASGFAAAVPSEYILSQNQETRTPAETAFGLAASTALGGLIGGSMSVLHPGEAALLENELVQAARVSRSVGAAEVELPDAGGLASGAQTLAALNDKTVVLTNPVTQTINQKEFESFRVFMQQLSDSGLRMEKNAEGVATSIGGTIENRLHYYTGMLVRGDEAFDSAYAKYIFDGAPPGIAPNLRAQLSGQFGSKLGAGEFADEVTRAIWNGFKHDVPEVAEAAKAVANEVYEPLLKMAQEVKLLPDDIKVVGDEAYANRVYNTQAIKAYTDEFVSILAKNYEKDLGQRFADELEKFKGKQAKKQELLTDLQRPESEVQELETKFREELKATEENLPPEIQMLEEAIATNRATARAMLQNADTLENQATRKQLLADAREMEKAAGEEYAKIKGKRAELRRRLGNLTKSVVALDAKQAQKISRINKIEELNLNSLGRLVKKAQRTLQNLERWNDDKLDEEVSRLKNMFAQTAKVYDRGEERLTQLRGEEAVNDAPAVAELPAPEEIKLDPKIAHKAAAARRAVRLSQETADIEAQLEQLGDQIPDSLMKRLKKAQAEPNNDKNWSALATAVEAWAKNGNPKPRPKILNLFYRIDDLVMGVDDSTYMQHVREYEEMFPSQIQGYRDVPLETLESWQKAAKEAEKPDADESMKAWARDPVDLHAIEKVIGEKRRAQVANTNAAANAEQNLHKLGAVEDLQTDRAARLDDIAKRLEDTENLPREEIRATIEEGLTETLTKISKLNERRILRAQRLREQAAKLDPEIARGRIKTIADEIPQAEGDFVRRWEGPDFKASSVNLENGIADFRDVARESAELVKDKILGTYMRLPYSEVMQERRGAELRRVLHISSKEIDKFLDKDIRRLTRVYTRTLGPDIEFMNKFGTLNGEELLKPAIDEMNAKIAALGQKEKPEGLSAKAWEERQKKASLKINEDFNLHKKNVLAVIERLRGTRGMPSDPDGFAYRAARTIMNLNVLRMMGMVTVSSLPDMARPVMRYGLTRVFNDGFAPLVSNLKAMKLNAAEAKLAGVATDVSAHMRSMAYRDITDELHRGSKLEKAVEWTSNRMGMVALFDYWTQAGELLSSSVANAKLMDAISRVATGQGKLSERAANTFLAENGITGELADKIWKEVQAGGGGKVNGTWWPNTESWKDTKALRAYRAALAREVMITIPRPGAERALLSDANMLGRMLYQFKSFGMSAMPKILLSGMQQRDAAALNGALASLALGALSYYLWGLTSGGKAKTEMLNAGLDKWADEAISRSGIVGNFGEVQRLAQTIPLFAPYASFSGQRQTRRPGDDLGEALLGPSFDFFQKATGVVAGLDQPTQGTLAQARRLTPFQNTLILREALDAVEGAVAKHLPERRSQ